MTWKPRILSRLQDAWRSRSEPENMRTIAIVYWQILVLIGIVAIVCTIVFAMQELNFVAQAQNPPPLTKTDSGPTLDRMQLEATLTLYENRAAQYRTVASSTPTALPDPSK